MRLVEHRNCRCVMIPAEREMTITVDAAAYPAGALYSVQIGDRLWIDCPGLDAGPGATRIDVLAGTEMTPQIAPESTLTPTD